MSCPVTIVWFRNDLRLADHPALHAAAGRGGSVVPLFVWAPDEERSWAPGAASRWWLHHSLEALRDAVEARGGRLLLRAGPAAEALVRVAQESGADAVHVNRCWEPEIARRDRAVESRLARAGVAVRWFAADLLFEPRAIATGSGTPYKVFTPFWRACLQRGAVAGPLPAPARLRPTPGPLASLAVTDLGLLPRHHWAEGLARSWAPGEAGARQRLREFCRECLAEYDQSRDRPDIEATSRLSPHLHFGEISPRQVWQAVRAAAAGAEPFLRQLGWREFAHHLLHHFPQTPEEPLRAEFRRFEWRRDRTALDAWHRGRTGYPIVDAGMRELWETGWMHNRVRMIVASFLVKDLLISWVEGARWFWDTLVDADLANNTLGWQWTAGCGADAAPYIRVFNPVTQGERFDPQGDYVRRWVPELARMPADWIHAPWTTPAAARARAGVELGRDYPQPIVDHAEARRRALLVFDRLRLSEPASRRAERS